MRIMKWSLFATLSNHPDIKDARVLNGGSTPLGHVSKWRQAPWILNFWNNSPFEESSNGSSVVQSVTWSLYRLRHRGSAQSSFVLVL